LQFFRTQGVTELVKAVLPVVHWQIISSIPQPAAAAPAVKHENEHAGSELKSTAAKVVDERAKSAATNENLMVIEF